MTIAEYQREASRTCPDLGHLSYNLLHMEMGICTEMAELLDPYKKWLAYGKVIDMTNIAEELADAMWYIVNEARFNNYEFEEGYEPKSNFTEQAPEMSLIIFEILNFIRMRNTGSFLRYTDMVNHLKGIAILVGIDFEQALERNIAKLRVRFPDKFDADKAINRNVDAEREVL